MPTTTKPILFSTPMVQANLNGTKTQTRRTQGLEKFNTNPDWFRYDGVANYPDQPQFYRHYFETLDVHGEPTEKYTHVDCKVKPGDIFWVRETFKLSEFPEADGKYEFKADMEDPDAIWNKGIWKPSIFMPKEACRLFLKVTNVKVERLQDISESDAIAEGIQELERWPEAPDKPFFKDYLSKDKTIGTIDPTFSFATLWESINGKNSFKANPWVWVYKFEQCEMPKDFLK